MTLPPSRRHFMRRVLRVGAGAAASTALPMAAFPAHAALAGERALQLMHTHTQERLSIVYATGEQYHPEALARLDRFLRDHYSGAVGRMDARVFDLLHRVQRELGQGGAFEVISGYRDPGTNERLRATRGGGVARHSLHMEGRAIDLRLTGVALADLRDAARALHGGGVGYYPVERFVHIDNGRVRTW